MATTNAPVLISPHCVSLSANSFMTGTCIEPIINWSV